jgi:pimeloyl-ACP methyl ester carboxylesterase
LSKATVRDESNCLFIAGFLLFIKSIAARKRWYWALQKDAGRVASRLARANKNKHKTQNRKASVMNTQKSNQQRSKAIVLVHGGFVDGSGWAGVYNILKKKGYNVLIVQNPTKTLAEDVAVTKSAIESLDSDVVLVGHSYGGVVITEAGTHPKVSDLVYITAFAPDKGESVASLIANPPPGAPVPPILPPKDGYLFLDRAKFAASFAADVEPELASFMADSQVPWGLDALQGAVSEPAWKTKPTYYLVATEDKMIPPPAQRTMAGRAGAQVIEVPGSHAIYVSKPAEVAEIIEKAADSSN